MGVEVRLSTIHRYGVFAMRSFQAGEIVLKWDTSARVARSQAESVSDSEKPYLHPYDSDSFIIVQSPERNVNHSCDHNTEVHDFCDVAIRDISVGEEITSNYEIDGAGHVFTCQCGSALCRGVIGGNP